jgi:hypothetical protein
MLLLVAAADAVPYLASVARNHMLPAVLLLVVGVWHS